MDSDSNFFDGDVDPQGRILAPIWQVEVIEDFVAIDWTYMHLSQWLKGETVPDEEPKELGAFEKDQMSRMSVELARYWLISTYLAEDELPKPASFFAYAEGPVHSIDWGSEILQGKRIRVSLEIEDYG